MNPLVKKILDWVEETAFACFIEIILEVFVHAWNRCIEAFNWNLRPFDIEYLFAVSNAVDVSTMYDVKDFSDQCMIGAVTDQYETDYAPVIAPAISTSELSASDEYEVIQDSIHSNNVTESEIDDHTESHDLLNIDEQEPLIATEDRNIYLQTITKYFSTDEYTVLEDIFNSHEDSANSVIDEEINLKYFQTSEKDEEKFPTHHLNISRNHINANGNMSTADDTTDAIPKTEVKNTHSLNLDNTFSSLNEELVKNENIPINDLFAIEVETEHATSNEDYLPKIYQENDILPSWHIENAVQTEIEGVSHTKRDRNDRNPFTNYTEVESLKKPDAVSPEFAGDEETWMKVSGGQNQKILQSQINTELERNATDKRKVLFKDEVKVYMYEPFLSIAENFSSDDLIRENSFIDMIKDEHDVVVADYTNRYEGQCFRITSHYDFENDFEGGHISLSDSEFTDGKKGIDDYMYESLLNSEDFRITAHDDLEDAFKVGRISFYDNEFTEGKKEVDDSETCGLTGKYQDEVLIQNRNIPISNIQGNIYLDNGTAQDFFKDSLCDKPTPYRTVENFSSGHFVKPENDNKILHRNDVINDIESELVEDLSSYNPKETTYDAYRKSESHPTVDDKNIEREKMLCDDREENMLDIYLRTSVEEDLKCLEIQKSKLNIEKESVKYEKNANQVHVKEEVKISEPHPRTLENCSSEKSSVKENALKDDIKDIRVRFRRRLRRQDYIIEESSSADIDNIVYIGKKKAKYWPKRIFSRHIFRKRKSDVGSLSDKNEDTEKHISEKVKVDRKSPKKSILSNYFKM